MRYKRVLMVVLAISAVLAAEWFWLAAARVHAPGAAGPIITTQGHAPGGPFTLTDQRGQVVTDATYRGKYVVMAFGYTHCPDVCPTTLSAVAAALDLLGPRAGDVQPIFVSVDPERDTPAVLADYVAAFHPRLVGLTGTPEQIRAVTRDYRVYVSKVDTGDDDYPVDHSAYLYLIGPDGKVLTYLKHDASPQTIADTIGRLMDGRAPGRGAGRSAGASPAGPRG
jgi:cytochrome oxidase Cu insertion factor (SCO1/SenC/PrrC family)